MLNVVRVTSARQVAYQRFRVPGRRTLGRWGPAGISRAEPEIRDRILLKLGEEFL